MADTLSIARTVATSAENETVWDGSSAAGGRSWPAARPTAVDDHDPAALEAVGRELAELRARARRRRAAPAAWQEYGGLLINLRNVHDSLAKVTEWNHDGPARRAAEQALLGRGPRSAAPPD